MNQFDHQKASFRGLLKDVKDRGARKVKRLRRVESQAPCLDEVDFARRVTSGPRHHFFGYYDKCPWDASGRYLLAHATDFAARTPKPGEVATIGMVDLECDCRFIPLDQTTAWSLQQGAMLQWLGS